MDWSKGYSAQYYMTTVDASSWRDDGRIEITGGKVKRENKGLMQSADVDCINYPSGLERYVRIWLVTRQTGASEKVALFTGLATTPDREINGNLESVGVQCYSVLKPAEDVLLDRGWYAPEGMNGANLAKRMLGDVIHAPIEIDGESPNLQNAIVAEDGETCLSMVQNILDAINWRMRITGDGVVTICPKASTPTVRYDPLSNDAIEPEIKLSDDWYDCPNVFRAIQDDLMAIARDDSENSELSTVNRGREIWQEENNCDLNDGESIAEYAVRRLKEEQAHGRTISYDRRYNPNIYPSDIIELRYPAQGITGNYTVVSQTINLGYGAQTAEEVMA